MYSHVSHSRLARFGYRFIGPLLVDWYNRLSTAIGGDNVDTVYLLGREGWNLVPYFNTLEGMRRDGRRRRYMYLTASRGLLTHISLSDERLSLIGFNTRFAGTVGDFFESRLGVPFELLDMAWLEDQTVVLPRDKAYLLRLFESGKALATALAERSRSAYGRYLTEMGFATDRRHVISDLGFRGTTQALIAGIYNFQIDGYYALLDPGGVPEPLALAAGSTHGLFSHTRRFGDGFPPLENSLLLEAILTAPFGQVIGIQERENGDPFLYRSGGPAQRSFGLVAESMQGAFKFAYDNLHRIGSPDVIIEDFPLFFDSYKAALAEGLDDFAPLLSLDDSYFGAGLISASSML